MKAALLDFSTLNLAPSTLAPLSDQLQSLQIYSATSQEETLSRCLGQQAVFTNKVILNQDIIEQCPELKYIGVLATGTNNVDLGYCQTKGIVVCNAKSYSTESVAQHTLGLMLNLCTNQSLYISESKTLWPQARIFCRLDHKIFQLKGKCLGIIGYGEIGQRVAHLAKAFGMNVIVAESFTGRSHNNRVPLSQLIHKSDFVSLHCPLSEKTHGLVDSAFIEQMKSSSFLINTARGPIVCEKDLAQALSNNSIAGAAIDVLSEEPAKKENPLLKVESKQLIITPHIAWASEEARSELIKITANNFKNYIESL